MNRKEAIEILSILKAAYPNSYKGMTKEEANGTITVWTMQFTDIPANVVFIAVNQIISKSPFPPAISEVRHKIRLLYYEAQAMLRQHEDATIGDPDFGTWGEPLDEQTLATVKEIIKATTALRNSGKDELSLEDLLTNKNAGFLLPSNENKGELQ